MELTFQQRTQTNEVGLAQAREALTGTNLAAPPLGTGLHPVIAQALAPFLTNHSNVGLEDGERWAPHYRHVLHNAANALSQAYKRQIEVVAEEFGVTQEDLEDAVVRRLVGSARG